MLFGWCVEAAVPVRGSVGESPLGEVGDGVPDPWSAFELERENMNEERLPDRLLRWLGLVSPAFFSFSFSFPCFEASWSELLLSAEPREFGREFSIAQTLDHRRKLLP